MENDKTVSQWETKVLSLKCFMKNGASQSVLQVWFWWKGLLSFLIQSSLETENELLARLALLNKLTLVLRTFHTFLSVRHVQLHLRQSFQVKRDLNMSSFLFLCFQSL